MARISLITLCYNQLKNATVPMLKSLYEYTNPELFELIMVNNASTDGTKEFLEEFSKDKNNIKIINNDENFGFAKGMNQGLKIASGEYIFLLNNDLLFTPNWLEKFVEILKNNNDIGLISCMTNYSGEDFQKIENADRYTINNYIELSKNLKGNNFKYLENTRVVFFCVGITRQVLERVGYLDEKFGQCWFEDDDYTLRILYEGFKIAIAKDIFIYHNHSQSTAKLSKTDEGKKLFQKNKNYFEKKHHLFTLLKNQAELEKGKEFLTIKNKFYKYRKIYNILLPIAIIEFIIIVIELIIFLSRI